MQLCVTLPRGSGIATYPAGATFGPRQMRDWEFVWVIEGHARYVATTAQGETVVTAPPGSIVLCRPGVTDFFWWDETQRTRHAFFHFNIESFPSNWPAIEQWPLVRVGEDGDILRPLFRHLLTWQGRGDEELMRLTIAHMVTAWVRDEVATRDVPLDHLPEAVERVYHYVQERFEADAAVSISLQELARAACMSREHLCRVFKGATGHTPVETVRLARLDRAATLLARSNYSIAEIASMCGFASPFHFSRQFKVAFHQSPTSLRASIQNGSTPPTPRLLRVSTPTA